jgi:hypothetical protein
MTLGEAAHSLRALPRQSNRKETTMPGKHTVKQERQAKHIEQGYEKKGVSKDEAEHRAWATVNKEQGTGKGKSTETHKK